MADPPRLLAALPAAEALLRAMRDAASRDAAIAAFEAAFPMLPAFASAALLAAAAELYAQDGRGLAARLLHGLSLQLQPATQRTLPAPTGSDPDIAAVLRDRQPQERLQEAVLQRDGSDDAGVAALFEAVLAALPPLDAYWVYYRMALVYERLQQEDAAFLLSAVAVQLEPEADVSELPMRRVMARLVDRQAWPQALALRNRWLAANPGRLLLDPPRRAALAPHASKAPRWRPTGRRDRLLLPPEERPAAARVRAVGRALPECLRELLQPVVRPAITLAELTDPELLVADGSVSVWAADGTPQAELSVGSPAGLVRWRLQQHAAQGGAVVQETLDGAVLIADQFPAANLCHFLLDHATRLPLYARAGLDLGAQVVIGPTLRQPFQREVARRLGARRYLGLPDAARLQVRRLAVVSSCHHLRHTAHLGAAWALDAVRRGFADLLAGIRPHRRLFISRADAASRRLADEPAVFAALQPYGFERIVPGLLPLAQQVQAFAAATHVVAPHGAALAHIAFCAPGTRVLEMFHPHYGTYSYAMLADPLGLDYAGMVGFDGESDAAADNDPALAAQQRRRGSERDLRADLPSLQEWLREA